MTSRPSPTIVLVAGAWHGSWCWSRLAPLLRDAGHPVLMPELPATGSDAGDPATVTLDGWARFLVEVIGTQAAPVVLVGHSRAGVLISRVAELASDRVRRLVYLSAYLLPAGGTLAEFARADEASLVPANMMPAASGTTTTLRPEVLRDAFYGDCDAETVDWARARLSAEPLKPLVTALKTTPERFGCVPRAYVECTRDRTISLPAQRRMHAALPCHPVITLESDHSPFLSHPRELAQVLDELARL